MLVRSCLILEINAVDCQVKNVWINLVYMKRDRI